jgi:hypothetical protein
VTENPVTESARTQPCPVCGQQTNMTNAHHKRFRTDAEDDAWRIGHQEGWNHCLHEWIEQDKIIRKRLRDVFAFIEKIAGNGGARANEDEAVTLGRLVREAREIQARMGG